MKLIIINNYSSIIFKVHCCFYFISPIGYGLKPTDIEFMKRLSGKVNIIPIIGKADCLTKDELSKMKKRILNDIQDNGILIYRLVLEFNI